MRIYPSLLTSFGFWFLRHFDILVLFWWWIWWFFSLYHHYDHLDNDYLGDQPTVVNSAATLDSRSCCKLQLMNVFLYFCVFVFLYLIFLHFVHSNLLGHFWWRTRMWCGIFWESTLFYYSLNHLFWEYALFYNAMNHFVGSYNPGVPFAVLYGVRGESRSKLSSDYDFFLCQIMKIFLALISCLNIGWWRRINRQIMIFCLNIVRCQDPFV